MAGHVVGRAEPTQTELYSSGGGFCLSSRSGKSVEPVRRAKAVDVHSRPLHRLLLPRARMTVDRRDHSATSIGGLCPKQRLHKVQEQKMAVCDSVVFRRCRQ